MFRCQISVRVRDLNIAAHVDNVEVLRIVDEARQRFLGSEAIDRTRGALVPLLPADVVTLVASQHVQYRAELPYSSEPFRLFLWIGYVGSSSFTVQTELRRPETADDAPADSVAETVVVLADTGTGRPWVFDDRVRSWLLARVDTPVELRPRPKR